MTKRHNSSPAGFTLVELIITLSIIVTLAAVSFLMLANEPKEAENMKKEADLEMIRTQVEMEVLKSGKVPTFIAPK